MGCTNIRVAGVVLADMMHLPDGTEILDIQRSGRDDGTYLMTVVGPEVPNTAECHAVYTRQAPVLVNFKPIMLDPPAPLLVGEGEAAELLKWAAELADSHVSQELSDGGCGAEITSDVNRLQRLRAYLKQLEGGK